MCRTISVRAARWRCRDGDEIVPLVNRLAADFTHVVVTQDWHPPGHASFASAHPGRRPYDTVALDYGPQILWPDHCVQGTAGAAFHRGLDLPGVELVIRKGFHPAIDSYSAFRENDRKTPTGLAGYLCERGLARITIAGLATDFCVLYSALDAREAGFETAVALAACRGIDIDGSVEKALAAMKAAGVSLLMSFSPQAGRGVSLPCYRAAGRGDGAAGGARRRIDAPGKTPPGPSAHSWRGRRHATAAVSGEVPCRACAPAFRWAAPRCVEPSSFVPCNPAIAALAARSVAMSTQPWRSRAPVAGSRAISALSTMP